MLVNLFCFYFYFLRIMNSFYLCEAMMKNMIHYHIFFFWEFFTPALIDGFSLESEWKQVSLSLQDSSQYSGRSQL